MLTEKTRAELSALARDIAFDEPMSRHITFRVGGNADAFVNASSAEEIAAVRSYCNENDIPFLCIGNGSNMLVRDEGIEGVVLCIGSNMADVRVEGGTIFAGAGALMSKVAAAAQKAELTGFEALAGIPGSIGGAVFMNAGAYGAEIGNVLVSVEYIDKEGQLHTAQASELDLSYRHSVFAENGGIVVSAKLGLKKGNAEEIAAAMKDYMTRRRDKQPLEYPSAGSTFKRPPGHFAGALIEQCGLKGYTVGGAQISEKHAGFVINKGGATAGDILTLMEDVKRIVKEKTGVTLEAEVRICSSR